MGSTECKVKGCMPKVKYHAGEKITINIEVDNSSCAKKVE